MKEAQQLKFIKNLKKIWKYKGGYLPLHPGRKKGSS
jgi:hypothetical protein